MMSLPRNTDNKMDGHGNDTAKVNPSETGSGSDTENGTRHCAMIAYMSQPSNKSC
jgi:hypothetical protein